MEDLCELYKKLYNLTEKQKRLIDNGEFDNLVEVLEKKDKLIEKIDKRNLESYIKKQDKPKEVYKKIRDIMKKTKKLEDDNIEKLQEKSSDIKARMTELNRKENRRKGYNKKSSFEAKFIDEKS